MSIFSDVKHEIGIISEDTAFDLQILKDINLAFGVLYQIGACDNVTKIDMNTEWEGLFNDESIDQFAREYVYLKVRLLFDPPSNSTVLKQLEDQASEYEWRIYAVNNKKE